MLTSLRRIHNTFTKYGVRVTSLYLVYCICAI